MIYSDNFAFSLQGWPWPIPGVPGDEEEDDDEVTTTTGISTTSHATVTGGTDETTTHFIGKKKQLNTEDIINRLFKIKVSKRFYPKHSTFHETCSAHIRVSYASKILYR